MSRKTLIWVGLTIGSTVGSLIPMIWGDTMLSFWSVILSALGGLGGIYLGYKLGD